MMMLKRSLIFSFGLLFLGFNAFGDVWYSENFDNFKDDDIAGQDDWKTAMNQGTCQIGSEVNDPILKDWACAKRIPNVHFTS